MVVGIFKRHRHSAVKKKKRSICKETVNLRGKKMKNVIILFFLKMEDILIGGMVIL